MVKALDILNNLYSELDSWEYGVVINGIRYGEDDLDQVDWNLYKTCPVSDLAKTKIGTCWDFVNYQHAELSTASIQDETYMFLLDCEEYDRDDIITHTFTVAIVDEKKYWLEQALYAKRGIHEIDGYGNVVKELLAFYNVESLSSPSFALFKYDPDTLNEEMTGSEFVACVTDSMPLVSFENGEYRLEQKSDDFRV